MTIHSLDLPTLLIIGKIGQVGWELRRTLAPLGNVVAVDYPEIDLTKSDTVRQWVQKIRPQVIINAAAYTAVDKAESEPELAMAINGIAPGILAEEAKAIGALLVHYSTDYVYDGNKASPYTEEDTPNPLSAYGRSKLAGDWAIQQVDGNYLIFRLCWVYGARGSNFMLTIMRLAREREKLRVVQDQIGSPTWSRMIAEITVQVLVQGRGDLLAGDAKGIYHLSAAGATSWHGFAKSIVEAMPPEGKKCHAVEAINTAEYPTAARRPPNSVLSNDKLKKRFGLQLPDWTESLRLVLDVNP